MFRVPDPLVRRIFEPAWDLRERSVRLATLRELRRSQWADPADLAALQSRRLREMVTHAAAASPLYRRRFADAGIDPAAVRGIADLAGLPLLSKEDVRRHLDELVATTHDADRLVEAKTGGSTGVALRVLADPACIQRRAGAALRGDEWSGWRLGEPIAAVWGNPPVPTTWREKLRTTLKERFIYLDTMRIDAAAVDRFLDDWRRARPGMLYGHAHSIFILAEALADRGARLRPRSIVATSMMLLAPERRVIEEVFGTAVTNRYGCEEVSLIACECERHEGLHLNSEHNWVELLRDDGTPCAPGEDGRIVVTELINFGAPMIRYEVGDRGVLADRPCSCGRGLPLLAAVTGRTADFLVAADGSRVAGISLIENTLTLLPGIRQMQLVQERPDHVAARVVRGADHDAGVDADLVAALRRGLGAEFGVEIVHVDVISQEASGKYRFSICRL